MTACSDASTFVHLCQPSKTDARNLYAPEKPMHVTYS